MSRFFATFCSALSIPNSLLIIPVSFFWKIRSLSLLLTNAANYPSTWESVALNADLDAIVDGLHQILFRPQIPFGRLNTGMPQQQLNLLEIAAGFAAELRAGAAQIVRGELSRCTLIGSSALSVQGGGVNVRLSIAWSCEPRYCNHQEVAAIIGTLGAGLCGRNSRLYCLPCTRQTPAVVSQPLHQADAGFALAGEEG